MNLIKNIKISFGKIKKDMGDLKQNTTEWIVFLSQKQREADSRIKVLESRIAYLERKHLERYE